MNIVVKNLLAALAVFALTSVAFAIADEQSNNQQACANEAEGMTFDSAEERQDFLSSCMEELSARASSEEVVSEEATADAGNI